VGDKPAIVGGGTATVNELGLVAVPYGVVTVMGPVVAPLGMWAAMSVDELTTKLGSAVPLNETLVAPVKSVPWMSTRVPTVALVGENELIVGGDWVTVNEPVLVAVPDGVVTVMGPVVTPVGTWAVMSVAELTRKFVSEVPLNVTLVAPVRFVPWMSTLVPTDPPVGENELIVGCGAVVTVNEPPVAVPPGVVTEICPLVAPAGT
jgi:hypothetical protein